MAFWARLDRPRRVTFGVASAAVLVGSLLAAFAPGTANVPMATDGAPGAPKLAFVRSIPAEGASPLVRPIGLALGDHKVFVSDSGAGGVRVFSVNGADLGQIGRGVLSVPAYLAYDAMLRVLYVTDRELGAVLRFDDKGRRVADLEPSTETSVGWQPLGVAISSSGDIAVTDTSARHRVFVMTRTGEVRRVFGGEETSATPAGVNVSFDFPNGVAFLDKRLWVSDSNNQRIVVFSEDGTFERAIKVEGVTRGLTFVENRSGTKIRVAVVDALASRIVLLDGEGNEVARYGEAGSGQGQLAYPNDVVYDATSRQLFVADTGNARVQVWQVTWPEDSTPISRAVDHFRLSPMRLFGLGVVVLGLIGLAVALWPQHRAAQNLL